MPTPVRRPPSPADRGSPSKSPLSGTLLPLAHGDGAAAPAPTSPRTAEPGCAETERNRLNVAFEAIHGLAGCLDQMLRELRRGVPTAQWRVVQEEVMRVRRLVTKPPETTPPELREGPPRDEGPASQPPPEADSTGQPPTPPGPVGPSTPRPGS